MNKGKHSVSAAPTAWLLTVMAMLSLGSNADTLVGAGLRETGTYSGYDRLSLMGGAKMLLKSNAVLNDQAGSNYLKYHNWQVQGGIAPMLGPGLSRDDEFFSKPDEGKLGFTTPSVMDLFMAEFNHFDGSTALPSGTEVATMISVTNTAEPDRDIYCWNELSCMLTYKRAYTPILMDVVPNQLYKDQNVDWMINIQGVHSSGTTPNGRLPMEELSIDGALNYWGHTIDSETRLDSYRIDRLSAKVTDQKPNAQSKPRARFITGDSYIAPTALHCNYAGDDCWNVRTHARIDSVSANSGSIEGGQELTISGYGFEKGVDVTVAGVPCEVTSMSAEEVTCVTGVAAAASVDGEAQPGQPGIVQRIFDPTDDGRKVSIWDLENSAVPQSGKAHQLTFESANDSTEKVGYIWDGYFKAPDTANYRFYLSCDDACKLNLDSTNSLSSGLTFTPITIANRWWYSSWRDYLDPPLIDDENQYISEWISLAAGEYYKIDALHSNDGGSSHMTVSVEVETLPGASAGHPKATKETQQILIDQDNVAETWEIHVTDPSDGVYAIVWLDPETDEFVRTEENIKSNCPDWEFERRIRNPYYKDHVGSSVTVTKTNYDAAGLPDPVDASLIKTSVYTVQVDKRLDAPSFKAINVIKDPANPSTISVVRPTDIGGALGTAPLSGSYILNCPDPANPLMIHQTPEIKFNDWGPGIETKINENIPFLAGRVTVKDLGVPDQYYWENARRFALTFSGAEFDVPQCYATSGVIDPITGNNVVFSSKTISEYGTNKFFEPIPMEMLYSAATRPQILVTVDGIPAACAYDNCDYLYTTSTAQVTGQSLAGNVLSITGVNLPTDLANVMLGDVGCGPVTGTATSISCTLLNSPAAGTYAEVDVISADGRVAVQAGIPTITVALSTNSVTPNTDVNSAGGTIITIQGSGLPQKAENVAVTFGDNTGCTITATSDSEVSCEVNGFDQATLDLTQPMPVSVAVTPVKGNAGPNASNLSLTLLANPVATGISPNSVSPVLKQNLTIQLQGNFPDILDVNAYSAFVVATDYRRQINIVGVDNVAKTMTVKFNGAPSGTYQVKIQGPDGFINGAPLMLTTVIAVDDFNPKQGSVQGGTLVTITGGHFGNVPTDNPVKIGDNYCLVESTSDAEIKCRIQADSTTVASSAELIVFAKTSEEMQCNVGGAGCFFDYVAGTTTISGMTEAFDAASNSIQLTVTGTGFVAGDVVGTELWIDGKQQQTINVQATTATFALVDADDISSSDIKFYTAEGLPSSGMISSQAFTPALISVSPSTGSSGGTRLTVNGVGFGQNTQDLNLYHVQSGQNICSDVEFVSYGTFICQTIAVDISSTDDLMLAYAGQQAGCANTITPADCKLSQDPATSPKLTSVSLADADTIVFDGVNFPAGQDISCMYQGVMGTGVLASATQVSCTFEAGVPASDVAAEASVTFTDTISGVALTTDADGQTLTNALSIGAASTGLECSFAGGCSYSIAGNGIAGILQADDNNSIMICDNKCELDVAASTGQSAVCSIPALASTYSALTFDIATPGELEVQWTGTGSNMAALRDGINVQDLNDSTASGCYAQFDARPGYTFALDEVKIFLNNLNDKTPFVDDNLILQGSFDGVSFTNIYSYDESIHEGWNSVDWRDIGSIVYSSIRLQGAVSGSCRIGEVKVIGVEVYDDAATSTTCTPVLTISGNETPLDPITYNGAITPSLTDKTGVSPRFGSVLGGETVTFSGSGFSAGAATVMIDNRLCSVTSQTDTEIVCTTADKPYVPGNPTLSIKIDGVGNVATRGLVYRYVSRWSDKETWGNDIPPLEGEAVEIPSGQHLLVDQNVPKLAFVVVYGSLIFPSNDVDQTQERTFDAGYIMVNGGYVEIGTEEFPYMSKLTITMHGVESDPYLPVYGNKVLAVRYGQLEMHGKPRSHVWTDLDVTAPAGSNTITLSDVGGVALDWQVGESIVIASTDYNGRHAEQRTITGIINTTTKPRITLDRALEYEHIGVSSTYGAETIEMRAEVGLLSRNVIYRGDPETSATNMYGAHIMLHSPGDESVVGRIENCEFTDVGQAFKLGRYPIHFHMIGTVQKSYIKKNSIHQTYNRATTLHGVHYLEISGNVAYKAMGHTIFIEDAIETKNLIENNLIVDTRASNSLLNTDQTPACFWITHPDNIFRGNHAAGSDRYGYWYDLQTTSIGPSFDPNVCPENTKLGEFADNVAHSVGRYGLRIFHNMIPRTNPCSPLVADPNMPNDPYHENPIIPARFYRLTSYRNNRNGVIAERVGAVEFIDFKTSDNLLAGAEVSLSEDVIDGYAKIIRGTFVGKDASNSEVEILDANPHGIITPRTENFTIDGASFYNYNWGTAAALGDCSHCFHPASTDSGARTVTTLNLMFDASVSKRIKYQYPWRGIWHDLDGTLTGLGADTYATFADNARKHVQQANECVLDTAVFDGVVCDPSVEIRRVAFYNYAPDHFRGMEMNILQYDTADILALSDADKQAYIDDSTNYSKIFFKEKLKPSNGWAVPFVTKHKYRITWANDLDYTNMVVEQSERWTPDDENLLFMLPFVDAREAINVTDTSANEQIMDETLTLPQDQWETGYNLLQNATEIREFQFVVNGKNPDVTRIRLQGLQCISGTCPMDTIIPVPISADAKFWSDPNTWPDQQKPREGEDVHIQPGWNIVLDEETPVLGLVTINGRLSFYDAEIETHLHAKHIYVRAGELLIGSEAQPFRKTSSAQITLYGERHEATTIMSGAVETGNKLLVNTGLMSFHGAPRDRFSRLRRSIYKDDNQFLVEPGLDWEAGDELFFAPTNHQWEHGEYRTITAVDDITGIVTVDSPFEWYHFGQEESTGAEFNGLDMRGEVRLLTRNVKIVGAATNDKWGGNILTMDRMEFDGTFRIATTQFDNVEVSGCSQENTYHAAVRFESTGQSEESYMKNSVVHHSEAWALYISSSKNIDVSTSDFIGAKAIGVNLNSVTNVHLDEIFVADVTKRIWTTGDQMLDKEACVAFCSYWEPNRCLNSSVTNSIAAGCAFAGFIAPGHECDDETSTKFKNNVAHSGERVGAHIYPDPSSSRSGTCYEGSHFSAYKNRDGGLTTMYKTADLRMRDMTFVDNEKGVCLQTAGERETISISMKDVQIYGEMDNLDAPQGQRAYCPDEKYGLMLFGANRGGKPLHPTMASQLPVHKIKSYAAWGAEITLTNVSFNNFDSQTQCGKKQTTMQRNKYAADYIPRHKFINTEFNNVEEAALIYLKEPPMSWANPTDCIEWPCTAPENVVLSFESTQFTGSRTPLSTRPTFQIVSDVEDAVNAYSGCELRDYWSAGYCTNRNLGILLFESLDADTEDRSIQPVHITCEESGYRNKLNSFMDHMWDGFYTGQKRLSRFPGQIETDGSDYTVQFSGTPANNMRFQLKADIGAVKIKIPYPNAGSYTIFANGNEMPYTPWDANLGRHAELTKTKGCGENRFVGVENFLEFYLTVDCEIEIVPRDAIMVSVRLDWTLDEFYADGGVDTFTDRMAAVLGVHASQIKTVAVYEGSVIVEFFVDTFMDDEEPEQTLNSANQNFVDAVMGGTLDFGAPVIDAMSDQKIVKTGYQGDHESGKTGNLWDDLINNRLDGNENTSNGATNNQSGNNSQTGGSGQVTDNTSGGNASGPTQSTTTSSDVITEEIVQPEMTETVKYLIVFLAVLSMALVVVIAYIAMRMCTRRDIKPAQRRMSEGKLEPQYAIEADNAKDIFSSKRRSKQNNIDTLGDATSCGRPSSSPSEAKLNIPQSAIELNTEAGVPDSARQLHSQRQ